MRGPETLPHHCKFWQPRGFYPSHSISFDFSPAYEKQSCFCTLLFIWTATPILFLSLSYLKDGQTWWFVRVIKHSNAVYSWRQWKSTKPLLLTLNSVYNTHKKTLNFCSLSHNYSEMTYNSVVIIYNLFLVWTILCLSLRQIPINYQGVMKSVRLKLIHIQCPLQEQICMNVHVQPALPNPIIRLWEEIINNRNKTSVGYDNLQGHFSSHSRLFQAHLVS